MEVFNPHDKFFKETFSLRENVIDFLRGTFPPEILKKLDLSTLTQDNNSYIDLESVIRYLYNASEIAVERVIDTLKEVSEEGGKLSMTIAAKLIEKGKIEGRMEGEREGERKGRIEGLKEAIEIGLELKYGVEGLKILERIKKIVVIEKLESIKEAVKISKNMEEIEKLL